MSELIGAVESTAELARQTRDWAQSSKRLEAFIMIVGGGALVVLAVVFFHSEQWNTIQENIVEPLLFLTTLICCLAVLGVIIRFHLDQRP